MKKHRKEYPATTRAVSFAFRNGLLGLSLLCSALLLTDNLNNIDAKHKLQDEQTAEVHQRAERLVQTLEQQQQAERTQYKAQQAQSLGRLDTRIDELNRLMEAEMDNVVQGHFKGKRYQEFELQRDQLMAEREELRSRQLEELRTYEASLATAFTSREADIRKREEEEKKAAIAAFNPDDPRANDKMVVSFLKSVESVRPSWVPTASQFIFLFSILLSLLVEMGIVLAFENVMLALAPILRLKIEGGLEQEILKTKLSNAQEKDDIQHEADLDNIRRKADQTVEKAKTYVEEGILNA